VAARAKGSGLLGSFSRGYLDPGVTHIHRLHGR